MVNDKLNKTKILITESMSQKLALNSEPSANADNMAENRPI
jgi:hypothetical protein